MTSLITFGLPIRPLALLYKPLHSPFPSAFFLARHVLRQPTNQDVYTDEIQSVNDKFNDLQKDVDKLKRANTDKSMSSSPKHRQTESTGTGEKETPVRNHPTMRW